MRFPLHFNKMQFPSRHICGWCKKANVNEPNSMAVLSGGAMFMDRRAGFGSPDMRLDGFLSLIWHGAHTNEGGTGLYPDIHECINIATDIRGGQYDINFCSTKCLRAFLNHVVDKLGKKISKEKRKKRSRKAKKGDKGVL